MNMVMLGSFLLAFVIAVYVILDGFDLGIGIIFPFFPNENHRNIMMSTIMPVWDGNETWLILGASLLYGIFPSAFAKLLPAFYIPITLMLTALIFRGVAFEFRFKATQYKAIWDYLFFIGSASATFLQGAILGSFIQGFPSSFEINMYQEYTWLNLFSFLTGLSLMAGYALLGACWLIIKTSSELQQKMYKVALFCLCLVAISIAYVSLWTPIVEVEIAKRWFSIPNLFYLAPLPISTAVIVLLAYKSLQNKEEKTPFIYSILIFLLSYVGLCISLWPYIIPRVMTIWDAAAPHSTLMFLFVGVGILMPILIGYTIHTYYVFKGKIIHEKQLHY